MFKVGDYVIYRRDLCIINSIVDNKYYKLNLIDDNSLSISVPIDNKLGYLRYPISSTIAKELINKIKSIEPIKIELTDQKLKSTY